MCFSAVASFVAGSVLGITGIVCLKKTKKTTFLFLASIPILFSLQQFTEGFVWLSFTNNYFYVGHKAFIHLFLLFALVIWPFFLPLSIFLIEENKKRKKILFLILLFGVALSLFMLHCLIFRTITAKIMFLHVYYDIDYTIELPLFKHLAYIIPTILPPFVSSHKKMKFFGSAVVLSFIITSIFFKENVVSIWCFFAAIISIIILLVISDKNTFSNEIKIN